MKNENNLLEVYNLLGIEAPAQFGSEDEEERRKIAARNYANQRKRIEKQLKDAAALRAKTIQYLTWAYFIIIGVLIVSIIIQFIIIVRSTIELSAIITFIEVACISAIFPIANRIEKNASFQSQIEFVITFLPDLDPGEAIKAIDHLFQAVSNPESLKKLVVQSGK